MFNIIKGICSIYGLLCSNNKDRDIFIHKHSSQDIHIKVQGTNPHTNLFSCTRMCRKYGGSQI